jgi:hypothetical protein
LDLADPVPPHRVPTIMRADDPPSVRNAVLPGDCIKLTPIASELYLPEDSS